MSRWWICSLFLASSVAFAGSGHSQLSSPQASLSIKSPVHNFSSLKKIIEARLKENEKKWPLAIKNRSIVSELIVAQGELYRELKGLFRKIQSEDSFENPKVALFNIYIKQLDFQDVLEPQFLEFSQRIANLSAAKIHLMLIKRMGANLGDLAHPWGEDQMKVYLNHLRYGDTNHTIEDWRFVNCREMVETDAYLVTRGLNSQIILPILPYIRTFHLLELLKFAEAHDIDLPRDFVADKIKEYKKYSYNNEQDVSLLAFQEALKNTKALGDKDLELLLSVRTPTQLSRFRRASHFIFDSSLVSSRFLPLVTALREYYHEHPNQWEPWQEQMFSFFSGLIPLANGKVAKEFCFLEAQPEIFLEAIHKITSAGHWSSFSYYVAQGSNLVDQLECEEGSIVPIQNLRIALFNAYKSSFPRYWTSGFFRSLDMVATASNPKELLQVTQILGNSPANLTKGWGKFQIQIFLEHHQNFGAFSSIKDWRFADNKAMVETNAYLLSRGLRRQAILKILPHIRTLHYLNLIRFVDEHQILLPRGFLENRLIQYEHFCETEEDYTLLAMKKGIADLKILQGEDLKLVLQVKTRADFERFNNATSYAYASTLKTTHERFRPIAEILRKFLLNKDNTWSAWQEEMYSFFEKLRPTERIIFKGIRAEKAIELSPEFCFIEAHPELGPGIMVNFETQFQFEVFKFYVNQNAKLINPAECQQKPANRIYKDVIILENFNLTPLQFAALSEDAKESKALPIDLQKFDFLKNQRQYDIFQLMKKNGVDPTLFSAEISSIYSPFQSVAARAMVTQVKHSFWSRYFSEILKVNSLLDAYAVCSLIGENRDITGATRVVQDGQNLAAVRARLEIKNSVEFLVVSLMERFGTGYKERMNPDLVNQILKRRIRHPHIVARISLRPDSAQIARVLEDNNLFHCADPNCIAWGKKSKDHQCEACKLTGCVECGKRSHNHQHGCDSFQKCGYVKPELFPGYANMQRGISNICFFNSFLKMFAMMVATSPKLKEWLAMPYQGPLDEKWTSVAESQKLKSILFSIIDDTIAGETPEEGMADRQRSLMEQLHKVARIKGRAQFVEGFGSQQRDSRVAFIEVLSAIGFEYSNMQTQISTFYRVNQLKYSSPVYEQRLFNIQLPIASCNSVQNCLESFFKPERRDNFPVLEMGNYSAFEFKGVTNRPPFLLLQLERFASESAWNKQKRIQVNQFITISQKSPADPREEIAQLKYQLTAVVAHSGYRDSSGHYRAFLFDPNQTKDSQPIEHNDGSVRQANEYSWKSDIESEGYLLSYKLVDVEESVKVPTTENDK